MCLTLSLLGLEHPEESSGEKAELPLAGVRQRGDHLGHGCLTTHTGETVVVCEQKPEGRSNMTSSPSVSIVIFIVLTMMKISIITVTMHTIFIM